MRPGHSWRSRRRPDATVFLTLTEVIETTRIHRVAGLTGHQAACVASRPRRAPHHTIADVGLIGGGQIPMPGEVSLAPHRLLCLDEVQEHTRQGPKVLTQPLEERVLYI
jgi:magnesium chelatase family protein